MKGTPDIMKKLENGCTLTEEEWIALIMERARTLVKLSKKYTVPRLADLRCLSPEYGKNDPPRDFARIGDDDPDFKGGHFWFYNSGGGDGYNVNFGINVPGIFFWLRNCDQYGKGKIQTSPWLDHEERTGLKRFFGIRCDYFVHWVYGWVVLGKKELRGQTAEKALIVAFENRGSRGYRDELDSVEGLMRVVRHSKLSPPELLIMLSGQVEAWEVRQKKAITEVKKRHAEIRNTLSRMNAVNKTIRRDLDRMNAENEAFKKATGEQAS